MQTTAGGLEKKRPQLENAHVLQSPFRLPTAGPNAHILSNKRAPYSNRCRVMAWPDLSSRFSQFGWTRSNGLIIREASGWTRILRELKKELKILHEKGVYKRGQIANSNLTASLSFLP